MKRMTATQRFYKIVRDRLCKRTLRHPENVGYYNIYQNFLMADNYFREAVCEGRINPELHTYWLYKAEQSTRSKLWPQIPNI